MKDINIGELNQRVVLQHISKTKQADGGNILTRSNYVTVWAKVEDTSTFEKMTLGRKEGNRIVKITVIFRDDITSDMGFSWNNEDYDIIAPIENIGQRNFFMTVKGELA